MDLISFINKHFKKNDTSITIDSITNKTIGDIESGDIVYTAVTTTIKENGKRKRINKRKDIYLLKETDGSKYTFVDCKGTEYKTSQTGIKIPMFTSDKLKQTEIQSLLDSYSGEEKRIEKIKHLEEVEIEEKAAA